MIWFQGFGGFIYFNQNIILYITPTYIMQKDKALSGFRYGEDEMTIGRALNLARGLEKGILTDAVRIKVQKNRDVVESILCTNKRSFTASTQALDRCVPR